MSKNWKFVYLPVLAVAVAVRVWCFGTLLGSPLRYFDRVPGLDMQTLLGFSEWFVNAPPEVFAVYRALAAAIWHLNGRSHIPEVLFAFQMAGGVVVALLGAYLAGLIFRRRAFALATGLVAALYGPALLYECVVLQESTAVFLTLAGVAAFAAAWRRRFSGWYGPAAGALLALATVGRPTALLLLPAALTGIFWSLRRRGVPWRRLAVNRVLATFGAMAAVLAAVSLFNYFEARHIGPFFNVMPYALSVNTARTLEPKTEVIAAPEIPQSKGSAIGAWIALGAKAAGRVPLLFWGEEIPENLNYYFIRERFAPLRFLPGPALLLPFAVAGIGLAVFSGRWRRREGVLLAVIMLLAVPLCATYPIGRYRLLLYPYLAVFAVYPVWWALRDRSVLLRRRCFIAGLCVVAAFGANELRGREPYWRSSDFVAWALAREARDGGTTAESVQEFFAAYEFSGGANQAALVNLFVRLIPAGELKSAEALAEDALARGKTDANIVCYYFGLIRLMQQRAVDAEALLRRCDPEQLGVLGGKLLFFRGEARRMQGDNAGALQCYREAQTRNRIAGFQPAIEAAIRRVTGLQ